MERQLTVLLLIQSDKKCLKLKCLSLYIYAIFFPNGPKTYIYRSFLKFNMCQLFFMRGHGISSTFLL